MNRVELVREMLNDGPVLARDLAIESGCSIRVASATLRHMERRGELEGHRFFAHAPDRGPRSSKIYARRPHHG